MRVKKSTVLPLILLIYLAVMSYIGYGSYSIGAISALYFYGGIGATLIVIFLLHLSLKRRERLRAEREANLSANSSAAQPISQSDASDEVVPEAPQNDKK